MLRPVVSMAKRGAERLTRLSWRRAEYRAVFEGTDHGRRVLADLYRFCGMTGPTHVPGDPVETAYNEGKRRVGLRIASILAHDPARMEQLKEQERDDGYDV